VRKCVRKHVSLHRCNLSHIPHLQLKEETSIKPASSSSCSDSILSQSFFVIFDQSTLPSDPGEALSIAVRTWQAAAHGRAVFGGHLPDLTFFLSLLSPSFFLSRSPSSLLPSAAAAVAFFLVFCRATRQNECYTGSERSSAGKGRRSETVCAREPTRRNARGRGATRSAQLAFFFAASTSSTHTVSTSTTPRTRPSHKSLRKCGARARTDTQPDTHSLRRPQQQSPALKGPCSRIEREQSRASGMSSRVGCGSWRPPQTPAAISLSPTFIRPPVAEQCHFASEF